MERSFDGVDFLLEVVADNVVHFKGDGVFFADAEVDVPDPDQSEQQHKDQRQDDAGVEVVRHLVGHFFGNLLVVQSLGAQKCLQAVEPLHHRDDFSKFGLDEGRIVLEHHLLHHLQLVVFSSNKRTVSSKIQRSVVHQGQSVVHVLSQFLLDHPQIGLVPVVEQVHGVVIIGPDLNYGVLN